MCGICGCSENEITSHTEHDHDHYHLVHIEQDLLAQNNEFAEQNRKYFKKYNVLALNIVSSPGSGKTTLLVKTITLLKNKLSFSVIEGDQHTSLDADRIRQTQVPVIQINTGKMCHLDAHQVGHALETLKPKSNSILLIENVGNLICPSLFDLGEACKVVLLSVTEGEDKPLKYPDMFHEADVLIINKIDLLPYVPFDIEKSIEYAKRINPDIKIIKTSAIHETGLIDWFDWLLTCRHQIT